MSWEAGVAQCRPRSEIPNGPFGFRLRVVGLGTPNATLDLLLGDAEAGSLGTFDECAYPDLTVAASSA